MQPRRQVRRRDQGTIVCPRSHPPVGWIDPPLVHTAYRVWRAQAVEGDRCALAHLSGLRERPVALCRPHALPSPRHLQHAEIVGSPSSAPKADRQAARRIAAIVRSGRRLTVMVNGTPSTGPGGAPSKPRAPGATICGSQPFHPPHLGIQRLYGRKLALRTDGARADWSAGKSGKPPVGSAIPLNPASKSTRLRRRGSNCLINLRHSARGRRWPDLRQVVLLSEISSHGDCCYR